MSIKVMSWVWSDCKQVSGNALLVLLALADYADDNGGNCFPSLDTLAEKARISRSTVIRTLDEMEEGELITRHRQGGNPGEAWKSTQYRILVPWVKPLCQSDTSLYRSSDTSLCHSSDTRSTIKPSVKSISREAQTPDPQPIPEPIDPIQAWFESIGIMLTPQDIPAINKMHAQGAAVEDLQDALAWWQSTGKTVHSARQMAASVEMAIKKRRQAAAPAASKHQSAKQARADAYEKLRLEVAAREERRAARKRERDGLADTAGGVAAGAIAPG